MTKVSAAGATPLAPRVMPLLEHPVFSALRNTPTRIATAQGGANSSGRPFREGEAAPGGPSRMEWGPAGPTLCLGAGSLGEESPHLSSLQEAFLPSSWCPKDPPHSTPTPSPNPRPFP